jgi:hypothetical protein
VFVELDVSGLVNGWQAARVTATLPVHRVGKIGRALVDLAARGLPDRRREIGEHLTARLRTDAA